MATKPIADPCQETIRSFAKRSDPAVLLITLLFAMGGAFIDIALGVSDALLGSRPAVFWGIWVPLCFITIPPLHYLCRKVWILQERVQALESQLKTEECREQCNA